MTAVLRRSLIALLLLTALVGPQYALTAQVSAEPGDHGHHAPVETEAIESGLALGDEGPAVAALQEFLEMAGFLAMHSGSRGVFDASTEAALIAYQHHHHLEPTGTVTESTLALVQTPRFDSMPDVEADEGRSLAYVTGNKWTTNNLTYAFKKYTPDLTQSAQRTALRQAFDTWAAVTPLTFTETGSTASADIVISFESGAHGDPCSSGCDFDGPFGVLAHAFYPPPNGGSIAGDTHFDEDEKWTLAIPVPSGGIDLKSVAIHEFGHALGLGHSSVQGAIMYPYYSGIDHDLHSDDIAGIQSLYGANSGGGGGETVDAEILSVTMSPSTTTVGNAVAGTVQVRNNGTQAAAIPVSVTGPGGYTFNQTTGSLAAGQSTNVGFSWTAGAAGSFSFTATANLSGDEVGGNNSRTSNSVTVSDPPQQTIDAEVVSASASPSTITQNSGNVTISTTVRNNGSASASIPVSVSGPNGWSSSTSRTLGAGASTTVQFSWPASATGTHTFTVSTSLSGDQSAANNSKTTNAVTVDSPAPSSDLFVSGMSITATQISGGHSLRAVVSIGPNGSAAANAYIYGYWRLPNGSYRFGYGYANGAGQVTIQTTTNQTGVHRFQVYRVIKSGYVYNPALNSGNPGELNVGGSVPPPAVIDASVNQVTASPASLALNSGNVSVVATVGNNGSNAASVPVSISGPNGWSSSQSISLAAGATGQVTFSWPASVAGNHTFSVSTNLSGDSNAANNQRTSPSVNVTQAATVDAEVVTLSRSTGSVEQDGPAVTFTANVRNNGGSTATFNVRLSSGTASVNEVRSVTVAAGATQAVAFQWSPDVAGDHSFTATSELGGDSNAGNNSKSTTLEVTAPSTPGGNELFVNRIHSVRVGSYWYVYVFVNDADGPVGGATLTASVRAQSGQVAYQSRVTGSSGYAVMVVRPVGYGSHTFTVHNLSKSGYEYNSALDNDNPTVLQ